MKNTHRNLLTASALIAGLVGFSSIAQAATVTWDGSEADNDWDNAANWDTNSVPVNGDDVFISDGSAVHGTEDNGSYNITLSGNSSIVNPASNVWRASGATVTVGAGSTFGGGGFYDLQNATMNFVDGSLLGTGNWEQKDTNVFNFELSSTGFTTMNGGTFRIGNGDLTADIANATYNVDMTNYTGGVGTIVLIDFTTDGYGMDNSIFQGAGGLNVNNTGAFTGSYLQWNDTTEAIELVVAVPEPSSFALIGGCLALASVMLRRRS
jgi:hypothetical protein